MFLLLTLFPSAALQATETQVWSEADLVTSWRKRLQVTVPFLVRTSIDQKNPQLAGGGAIADFSVFHWLSVSGGYLVATLPHAGPGYLVQLPLAAFTLKGHLGPSLWSGRQRVEKLFGLPHAPVRYRAKISVSVPLAGKWIPFVTNEFFYDFSASAWTQNRFQYGLGRQITSRLRLDGYVLERTRLQGNAAHIRAFGTTLAYAFPPRK